MINFKIAYIIIIALLLPLYLVVASIYELGHVLASLASGFRFQMMVIGAIGIKRDASGKLKMYI